MIFGVLGWVAATRQLGVTLFVFALQTLIYVELVRLAQRASVEARMPTFRAFYVYWFAVFAFFVYSAVLRAPVLAALGEGEREAVGGEGGADARPLPLPLALAPALRLLLPALRGLAWVLRNSVPVSFALYMGGLVAFVLSLHRRRNFRYQFQQFGFCHLALIVVMGQSSYLVSSAFQGLFWFILPITLVATNDCLAYVCGVLCGRTPLIRLVRAARARAARARIRMRRAAALAPPACTPSTVRLPRPSPACARAVAEKDGRGVCRRRLLHRRRRAAADDGGDAVARGARGHQARAAVPGVGARPRAVAAALRH